MNKKIIITALIMGVLAIIMGAFGAHGLKKYLTEAQLQSFETGVKYLMYHALFLLFIANTSVLLHNQKQTVFYFILVGIVFFSGSIFLLSTQVITKINFKFLGPITPIGGLLLIVGWLISLIQIIKNN